MTFKRAFFTVSGLTILSRITGLVRDIMAANILGAGMAADAFFVALRLPNLFRRLFAEGAFSISFVPLFTTALKEGKEEARTFAEQALAALLLVLIPFTTLMIVIMPYFMHVITPGYSDDPEKFSFAITLSRITFPYLLLISLAALMGSIMNALGRFGPYAAAPVAFNLTQLIALFFWNDNQIQAATAQAWAVTISGAVQLIWLIYAARKIDWKIRLVRPVLSPKIKRLLVLIGPGAMGAGIMQINIFIDMILASKLPEGAISYLSYSERLYQLPIGVIGIAISTALLPILSHALRTQPMEKAHEEQNRAIEFGLYLALPAAIALIFIPREILSVLFERGKFTPEVSYYTALAASAFALAIPAYTVNKVLTVAYYAREDTRTPFLISVRTVILNSVLAVSVIYLMLGTKYESIAHAGLALCTSMTSWLNAYFLSQRLKHDGHWVADQHFWPRIGAIFMSGFALGFVLWILSFLLEPAFSQTLWIRIAALGITVVIGMMSYFSIAHITGAQRLDEAWKMMKRRRNNAPPSSPLPEGE